MKNLILALFCLSLVGCSVFAAEPTPHELSKSCKDLSARPSIESFANSLSLLSSISPRWDFKNGENAEALICLLKSVVAYLERDVLNLSDKEYAAWLKQAPKEKRMFFRKAEGSLMLDTRIKLRLNGESLFPVFGTVAKHGGVKYTQIINSTFLIKQVLPHITSQEDLRSFESIYQDSLKAQFSSRDQTRIEERLQILKDVTPGLVPALQDVSRPNVFPLPPDRREEFLSELVEAAISGKLTEEMQKEFHKFDSFYGARNYGAQIEAAHLEGAIQNLSLPLRSRTWFHGAFMGVLLDYPKPFPAIKVSYYLPSIVVAVYFQHKPVFCCPNCPRDWRKNGLHWFGLPVRYRICRSECSRIRVL